MFEIVLFQRTLGPLDLILFGIGCVIGAGVYVLTGQVASTTTGPALVLSMIIAAIGAGLVRTLIVFKSPQCLLRQSYSSSAF
jgi:L-asparagine transporter-like permease